MAKKLTTKERVAMWSTILGLFSSFPRLLSLIERGVNWVSSQISIIQREQAKKKNEDAVKKAKEEKNTSQLDDLFKGN